jgi:hypothetical protein
VLCYGPSLFAARREGGLKLKALFEESATRCGLKIVFKLGSAFFVGEGNISFDPPRSPFCRMWDLAAVVTD